MNNWVTEKLIAHRGLHNDKFVENSIGAFEQAVNNNYAIELDVQMTTDHVLVVFHDDNMKRATGYDKDIRQCSYEEIKDLKLFNTEYKIPLFQEVLDTVNGKTEILVEIKNNKDYKTLSSLTLEHLLKYQGKYVVESFNPMIVLWFRKNAKNIFTGQLSCDFKNEKLNPLFKFLIKRLWIVKFNKSQFIAYDIKTIKERYVQRFKGKLPIIAWTVKSEEEKTDLKPYYDNIIFEKFIPNK